MTTNKSLQEIVNAIRVGPGGTAITVHESVLEAFRAAFNPELNALNIQLDESSDLYQRVKNLEDAYAYAEYYTEITGASGTLAATAEIGEGAVFVPNAFGNGYDAYVSESGADGYPTGELALDTDGSPLTIDPTNGFVLGGTPTGTTANYTLSGTPADERVCLVYKYRQPQKYFDGSKALDGYVIKQELELENLLGTSGQITVTNNGDNTLTLSIPNPTVLSELRAAGSTLALRKSDGSGGLSISGSGLQGGSAADSLPGVDLFTRILSIISGEDWYPQVKTSHYGNNADSAGTIVFSRARGTIAAPANIQAGDTMGVFMGKGYYNGFVNGAFFVITCEQTPTGDLIPSGFIFYVSDGDYHLPMLTLKSGGKAGVLNYNPQYEWDVNGDIGADTVHASSVQAADSNGLGFKDVGGTVGLRVIDGGQLERAVTDEPSTPPSGYIRDFVKVYNTDRGFPGTINSDGLTSLYCLCLIGDHTYTCGASGSGADFEGEPSVQDALNFISHYYIPPNVTITIQLNQGVLGATTLMSCLDITHPNSDRILLQGSSEDHKEFTMSAAPNPGAKTFQVDDQGGTYSAADFAPGGDYEDFMFFVANSTKNDGLYTVASASDSGSNIIITVNETINDATQDGTIYLPMSNWYQLKFDENEYAIKNHTPGSFNVNGIRFVGYGTGNASRGISTFNPGASISIDRSIVSGFYIQFQAGGNSGIKTSTEYGSYGSANLAYGGQVGFYSYGSSYLQVPHCVAGQNVFGFNCGNFGGIYAYYGIVGQCSVGMRAGDQSCTTGQNARVYNCATGMQGLGNGIVTDYLAVFSGNTVDRDPASGEGATGGWVI